MDDVLSGAESLITAKELKSQLIAILKSAGMTLHKWCSNHAELAEEDHSYSFPNEAESTTLGVSWRSRRDCFCFRVKLDNDIVVTKRQILSTIARLFDPIGLLGPIIKEKHICRLYSGNNASGNMTVPAQGVL
ncbi:uncharacterized protein LOC118182060 [Stegodyphus dumicola]|uniref:uncharacterized protein LOC118182060 n=1 Tax=Stegodyphus dumicola TaxID=202533 RepID=UPI0015B0E32F|nr:uncharacterized protein LOC118182060 [Stegodyphus dumicola]